MATTRASPGSTGRPSSSVDSSPAVDDGAGAHRASSAALAGAGRRWSTGKAASPRSQTSRQRVDERRAARQVEGDEAGRHPEHGVDRGQRPDGVLDRLGRGERGQVGEATRRELGADRAGRRRRRTARRRPGARAGWPAAPGAALRARPAPPSADAMSAPWANAGCAHVGVSRTSQSDEEGCATRGRRRCARGAARRRRPCRAPACRSSPRSRNVRPSSPITASSSGRRARMSAISSPAHSSTARA